MKEENLSAVSIADFLYEVDDSFPLPLSKRQNLEEYAEKLFSFATICAKVRDGKILSMVAGYTENLTGDIAYISVVATLKEARGKGLASECVKEFIEACRKKSIPAVHLYTDKSNEVARAMYKGIGFEDYHPKNEPRPRDTHLIYIIRKGKVI